MTTALDTGTFRKLTAFPAILPDATSIATLSNGANPSQFVNYANIGNTGLIARLRNLQSFTPTAAGLTVSMQADGFSLPSLDMLAASLIDPRSDAYGDPWNLAALEQILGTVQNATGADIAKWWANWSVELEQPSIAQKLQFPGLFSLSSAEQALAEKLGLLGPSPRGVLPRPVSWIIQNEYRGQIVDAVPYAKTINTTPAPQTFAVANARQGEMLVLASLACSAGSNADGLTVRIGIDNEEDFEDIPAYGVGQGKPVPVFVQAQNQIQIQGLSTSNVAAVEIAAVVWHVRLTDEIRVRLGLLTSGPAYDKITAGVL